MVYLRDPLPVGDEQPSGPLRLRLRRADGSLDGPSDQDAPVGARRCCPPWSRPYGSEPVAVAAGPPAG